MGSRLPMNSSAPISTVFCLSAEALFTRIGFPYSLTWFIILAAYSASSSLINSTKPYPWWVCVTRSLGRCTLTIRPACNINSHTRLSLTRSSRFPMYTVASLSCSLTDVRKCCLLWTTSLPMSSTRHTGQYRARWEELLRRLRKFTSIVRACGRAGRLFSVLFHFNVIYLTRIISYRRANSFCTSYVCYCQPKPPPPPLSVHCSASRITFTQTYRIEDQSWCSSFRKKQR